METLLDDYQEQPASPIAAPAGSTPLLLALSKMLERGAYYGLRAVLVLYMISTLQMDNQTALGILGWLSFALVVMEVMGGLLGDWVIGNKNAMVIGMALQAAGAFILATPTLVSLYIGIGLIGVGSGLYNPNIAANFGKSYLSQPQKLDALFALYYLAINLGAMFGVIILGRTAEALGYSMGFIASGLCFFGALVLILFTNKEGKYAKYKPGELQDYRWIKITLGVLIVGLFWGAYQLAGGYIVDLQNEFMDLPTPPISQFWLSFTSSTLTLIASGVAVVLWLLLYSTQFTKLLVGYGATILAYLTLWSIPLELNGSSFYFYCLSLLFLAIAEVHIAPVTQSLLTQYANPKYLASGMGLLLIPNKVISYAIGLFYANSMDDSTASLQVAIFLTVIVAVGLFVFVFANRGKDGTYVLYHRVEE